MEPETIEHNGEKIRIDLVTESHIPKLASFIYEHFLQDQSLNRALGHFDSPDESSMGRIHCRNIASHFANATAHATPKVSLVATNEKGTIIGIRLSEVDMLDPSTGKLKGSCDHRFAAHSVSLLFPVCFLDMYLNSFVKHALEYGGTMECSMYVYVSIKKVCMKVLCMYVVCMYSIGIKFSMSGLASRSSI